MKSLPEARRKPEAWSLQGAREEGENTQKFEKREHTKERKKERKRKEEKKT